MPARTTWSTLSIDLTLGSQVYFLIREFICLLALVQELEFLHNVFVSSRKQGDYESIQAAIHHILFPPFPVFHERLYCGSSGYDCISHAHTCANADNDAPAKHYATCSPDFHKYSHPDSH
jgi:hypothetical protein